MSESDNKPRSCHIVKWPDFTGYGFNLHAERGKAGQYIGKVDDGSPAEAAGLKTGDRIVEINGVNIGNENHQQVVGRIKAGGDEVTILVVDSETDSHYKDQKRAVRSNLPEVVKMSAARTRPEDDTQTEVVSEPEAEQTPVADEPEPPREPSPEPEREPSPEPEREPSPEPERVPTPEPTPEVDTVEEVQTNESDGPTVTTIVVGDEDEDSTFCPRLCHMTKWPDFQGYGFNLHAEKERTGQFIGQIDKDSPAEAAGLLEGDRIIEVNGANIEQESHRDVIMKIKAGGDEVTMLVLDRAADNHYKEKNITVSSSMANVKRQANAPRESAPAAVEVNSAHDDSSSQYCPRLCHMTKWPDFQGYGFNLHAEKEQTGQFIGQIDKDSPAEAAGLLEGDRIIEVNGANIEQESHRDVIMKIKAGGDEVTMLVLDRAADNHYKEKNITVSSSMANVKRQANAPRESSGINGTSEPASVPASKPVQSAPAPAIQQSTAAPVSQNGTGGGDMMKMSAKEMREMLKKKQKVDPKRNQLDFRTKVDMLQKM